MAVKSWQGIAVGVLIALALPMAYLFCAFLVQRGVLDFARMGGLKEVINSLGWNASVALLLGLIGIWTAGRAVGLRSPWAWLLLVVVALPVLAFVRFVSYATLGGAMGSPF